MPTSDSPGLKLLAEDEQDLAVISAALQDAVGKIGDISYEPGERRLTLVFNRYRWEGRRRERVRSALQLGSVKKVQARKLRRDAKDAVVELLSVTFEAGEAPAGVVAFSFAGGGDLRADVECLDAVLADISRSWSTQRTPEHKAE